MIKIILFTLFLSSNVSAMNFQKAHTGTFEHSEKKASPVGEVTLAQAAFGTFDLSQDSPRTPASVVEEQAESEMHHGTFGK